MSEIEGIWTVESAMIDGQAFDGAIVLEHKLILKGDEYKTVCKYGIMLETTYAIDTSPDPKHLDIRGVEEMAGKIAKGIYELDQDLLTICYTMPGEERPTSFECPEGSKAHRFVWRRMPNDERND